MNYRNLGKTGLKVSELSLGSYVNFGDFLDDKASTKILREAFDQGVNFFDTADNYSNGKAEISLGKAVKGLPREAYLISSKVFFPTMQGVNGRGLSRKHITESIHASLKRLDLEYIDIYFCHRFDPDTAVEDVVQTMNILIKQGKILYWGTSMWEPYQIIDAIRYANNANLIPPVVEQARYSMLTREEVEKERLDICREQNLGLFTFSPLFMGVLSGAYNNGIPENSLLAHDDYAFRRGRLTPKVISKVKALAQISMDLGLSTAQLALAWLLRLPELTTVITGASKMEHLKENLSAINQGEKLTTEVLDRIDKILSD
ncbi:MAG: aldo/keto reductase [Chloroflexi bacterium]|nr:aldo/keto reductase [Chloroflexota bacterium]